MQNYNSNVKSDLKTRCYAFSLSILELFDSIDSKKRSVWVIEDQLIRSATSIGANLVEARASSSRLEFKKFYEIALKSANETIYWLNLLKDAKLSTVQKVDPLLDECIQISKMLGTGVIKLKTKL
jgi:four helix bundle protein